jgi:hypothetical protein
VSLFSLLAENKDLLFDSRNQADRNAAWILLRLLRVRWEMSDEVVLFATNGDGTVDCAWCGERFSADLARPANNDEPICPECVKGAEEDALQMSRVEYIESLNSVDADLTPAQLNKEADKFEKWKSERGRWEMSANKYIVLLETYPDGKLAQVVNVCRAEKREQADEWIRGDIGTDRKRYGFEVEEAT